MSDTCIICRTKGFPSCRCVGAPPATPAEEVQAAFRERDALMAEAEAEAERLRHESSPDATSAEAVLEQDEAQEARLRAAIATTLRAVHAFHATLPPGETLPRQLVDALALLVEGHLLAALKGGGA